MKLSQSKRLFNLLKDGKEHSTVEILEVVYGGSHTGLARVGARIKDLKDDGRDIDGYFKPGSRSVYWYRLKNPPLPPPRYEMQVRNGQRVMVLLPSPQ
jgi:hypothetical protein